MYLSKPNRSLIGTVRLDGSKSISNRLLTLRALSGQWFEIAQLSTSRDTQTLVQLLEKWQNTDSETIETYDAGAAGTTFRFLTAFLAFQSGTQILTGSPRMLQRPIGALVEALQTLGAHIEYLGEAGFPPLRIAAPNLQATNELSIAADVSSQYISALLMLAPTLPNGLHLTLTGNIVSRSYIEMTLDLMRHFSIEADWTDDKIRIAPQKYQVHDLTVEADWSAASYYYALAALSNQVDLTLEGVFENSLQGDAVIAALGENFGIRTDYHETGVRLTQIADGATTFFEHDFLLCPDIAQTLAVICAGANVQGLFSGLETLAIKETDRIAALKKELGKIGVSFVKMPRHMSSKSNKTLYMLTIDNAFFANPDDNTVPTFETYDDHRMAMAFAPLAMLGKIEILDPAVVAKSYPKFWDDLTALGFEVGD